MIMNFILLLALLCHKIFGFYTAESEEQDVGPAASLRFANLDLLQRDETLIQIFFYPYKGAEKVRIPHFNNDHIIRAINPNKKTIVLFNGHPSADSVEPFDELKDTFLESEDTNVLLVFIDWTKHQITFLDALALSESFGQFIGDVFKNFGIRTNSYHFIGHCAGAEIATTTAKQLVEQYHDLKIPRLTVFDPFITNMTKLLLAPRYIDFIDVYHAGIYEPPFPPVGHIDFYPNAGVRQPGCNQTGILEQFTCHHRRSIYLYKESIYVTVQAVEAYFNDEEKDLRVKTNAKTATFGHFVDKFDTGAYYLPTFNSEPYLMDYF